MISYINQTPHGIMVNQKGRSGSWWYSTEWNAWQRLNVHERIGVWDHVSESDVPDEVRLAVKLELAS